MAIKHLEELIPTANPERVIEEVSRLLRQVGLTDVSAIEGAFADTLRLFAGDYPGYRESTTAYHDLEHTCAVLLCWTRLVHGAWIDGERFAPESVTLGAIAALFHDSGLIQKEDDRQGSGAKYTIGHEQRSIAFQSDYLRHHGYEERAVTDAGHMVSCTILFLHTEDIPFRTAEIELLGKMLGTADLLAQMGARSYLERLLLLYREFEEAHLPEYHREPELMEKTSEFFERVVRGRLARELGGVSRHLVAHFRERWGIDEDLYTDVMLRNINYLEQTLDEVHERYRERLRREGIVSRVERLEHKG